jgi:hypothetical protein
MKRELPGDYITVSTVGEKVKAVVPKPLPPVPPIDLYLICEIGSTRPKCVGSTGQRLQPITGQLIAFVYVYP